MESEHTCASWARAKSEQDRTQSASSLPFSKRISRSGWAHALLMSRLDRLRTLLRQQQVGKRTHRAIRAKGTPLADPT